MNRRVLVIDSSMRWTIDRSGFFAFAVLPLLVASGSAMGQGAPADPKADLEEVVITGSYIKRDGFSTIVPLQSVSAEDLSSSGVAQLGDSLKNFTSNTGSLLTDGESRRSGTTSFSLRGLGLASTLTLVNGKRAGIAPLGDSGGGGADFTDINQFPLAMIERIEVLKDGASAIYGSEAVAGVVNIITRRGFEGVELSGEIRGEGLSDAHAVNLGLGRVFDGGFFNLYATYYTQGMADRSEVDWFDERIMGNGDRRRSRLLSATGSPGSYLLATRNALGRPETLSNAVRFTDPDCLAAGGVFALNDAGVEDRTRCRYDFSEQSGIESAQHRVQAFTEAQYALSDKTTFYTEASFSRNKIETRAGSGVFTNGLVVGRNAGQVFIPGNHPFNFFVRNPTNPLALQYIGPAAWNNTIHTGVDLTCECRPLGAEFNGKSARYDRENDWTYLRMLAGFQHELPADWSLDVSLMYANGRFLITEPNYRADVFNDLVLSGEFNPFGTRLSNPNLISPKNGFSTSVNEEDTLRKFEGFDQAETETTQKVLDVIATGQLGALPAGPVGVAVGLQRRELHRRSFPEPLLAASESDTPALLYLSEGRQEVTAGFAEAVIPAHDKIEVQVALRYESYGETVGSTTDPKVGVLFNATDWLKIRGSWGSSFQAPSLTQTSESLARAVVNDSAVPVVGGGIACGPGGSSISLPVAIRGAANLKPQSADNVNFGMVLLPTDQLKVSVDYWKADYKDLIAPSESAQAIVDNDCRGDGRPNDPRVLRDGAGQLFRINTEIVNIGTLIAEGIDFSAAYERETSIGDLSFRVDASYVLTFDFERRGVKFDGVGSRNFSNGFGPQPELRANATIDWNRRNQGASLVARFIDSYRNDQSFNAPISSITVFDLQYRVEFDGVIGGKNSRTTFAIGADNVFDKDPPALNRFDSNGVLVTGINRYDRPGYDPLVHDARGRIVYLRARHSF